MRDNKGITIFGDGSQTRDYVNVTDVARANLAATQWSTPVVRSIDAVACNVGTGTETSVNELAETLLRSTGIEVPISHAEARAGELQRSAVSVEKAGRELNWTPQVSLQDGLKRTYDWISENEV